MVTLKQTPPVEAGFDAWVESLPVRWTAEQTELIRKAYGVGIESGSGDAAPLVVADILADLQMDYEVVAAALLHSAARQQRISSKDLEEQFGADIARLVDGVTKLDVIGDLHEHGGNASGQIESLRKMLLAMAQDVRVVLVELADRVCKMRALAAQPDEEQRRRVAQSTLDVFAPLANRLGIGQIKWELEDLSLRYLNPDNYKRLARALDERRTARERYIGAVVQRLSSELRESGIQAEVSGRVKHIYSIWRKMQRKQLAFEQIFDVRAVRILVGSVADCYAALGVVHSQWNHIRKEFDDYIANPKGNGYQSLHTAVVGPEGKTLEVQIRTPAMHENAELGVAAHWRYKEGGATRQVGLEQQIAWFRQILDWKQDGEGDGDILERFQAEALQDRVYVVSPKGTVVELVQGATPLDFAYHIHTEVGHRCRGAKVDGRIVPLTYELKTGEQVHVLTAKTGGPSRDWLSPHLGYLKSPRSRAKVRQWFKQQDHDKSVSAGRAALEREFQRLGINVKQIGLEKVAEKLNFVRLEELFAALGSGDLNTGAVVARVQEQVLPVPREETLPVSQKLRIEDRGAQITIRGVGNLLTQMARCCKPVPYDPIVGFITHGRGVTIHRQDCANVVRLQEHQRGRLIEVDWGGGGASTYSVDVEVEAYDRSGLLRDITSILANERVNVSAANTSTDAATVTARMVMTLEIADLEQLSRILDKIGQLPNVFDARRKI